MLRIGKVLPSQKSGRIYAGTNPGRVESIFNTIIVCNLTNIITIIKCYSTNFLEFQHQLNVLAIEASDNSTYFLDLLDVISSLPQQNILVARNHLMGHALVWSVMISNFETFI